MDLSSITPVKAAHTMQVEAPVDETSTTESHAAHPEARLDRG